MSTFKVKLEGSNVTHEGYGESAAVNSGPETSPTLMDREPPQESRWENGTFVPSGRASLHRVKMRPAEQPEMEPVFEENSRSPGHFDVRYRPVARRSEPEQSPAAAPDPYAQRINTLERLAARQLGVEEDTGPQMPDPSKYDFYDPQQEGEYHRDLQKYVEAQKQEALRPHQAAIQQTEIANYYNEAAKEYRDHPNFRDIESAVQYALRHWDGKTSIEQMFANAVDPAKAKPGWAGNIHTPKAIRNQLGAIAAHRAMVRKQWGR